MGQTTPEVQLIVTRVCQSGGVLTSEELVRELIDVYQLTELQAREAMFLAEIRLVRTNESGYLVPVSSVRRLRRFKTRK